MENYKCAFSATLLGGEFVCVQAENVVRRGGPDVACTSEQAHQQCERLFQLLKQAALPAFGVDDDLLSMPHSVQVKIQFGGLLGLRRQLDDVPAESGKIENIHDLVDRAVARHGGLEAIPCQALAEDMASYKLKRRR